MKHVTDLMAPLNLGWKARRTAELALMLAACDFGSISGIRFGSGCFPFQKGPNGFA